MVGTSNKSVPGMAIEKVGISPAKVVISCDLWLFYQHEISKGIPNESTKASYSISSFRLMIQLTKKKNSGVIQHGTEISEEIWSFRAGKINKHHLKMGNGWKWPILHHFTMFDVSLPCLITGGYIYIYIPQNNSPTSCSAFRLFINVYALRRAWSQLVNHYIIPKNILLIKNS